MALRMVAVALLAAACASTSVTPVARNQIMISTSAAPACGLSGAQKVASQMAAVETIRRGFQRYVIVGAQSDNNVGVVSTGPTGAYTTGSATAYGSQVHGQSQTTYTGGSTFVVGTNDASLGVILLNPGDPGFANGVDAKQTLGPDWEELVKKGIKTCT